MLQVSNLIYSDRVIRRFGKIYLISLFTYMENYKTGNFIFQSLATETLTWTRNSTEPYTKMSTKTL